jgi:hypothetical protein
MEEVKAVEGILSLTMTIFFPDRHGAIQDYIG